MSAEGKSGYKFMACVREDHGKAIYNVAFLNHAEYQNYFATIGSNRVRLSKLLSVSTPAVLCLEHSAYASMTM